MPSIAELEIHNQLAQYLDGAIQLYELEDHLLPMMWDLAESSDEQARELVGRIMNLIAENSRGDRDFGSLQRGLADAARPFVWSVYSLVRKMSYGEPKIETESANRSLRWEAEVAA